VKRMSLLLAALGARWCFSSAGLPFLVELGRQEWWAGGHRLPFILAVSGGAGGRSRWEPAAMHAGTGLLLAPRSPHDLPSSCRCPSPWSSWSECSPPFLRRSDGHTQTHCSCDSGCGRRRRRRRVNSHVKDGEERAPLPGAGGRINARRCEPWRGYLVPGRMLDFDHGKGG
jgi:hypothetical protein